MTASPDRNFFLDDFLRARTQDVSMAQVGGDGRGGDDDDVWILGIGFMADHHLFFLPAFFGGRQLIRRV